MRKRSSKAGTTTTAHETWRARCEDDHFVRHKCYLEPREKSHACGSATCAWDWCGVYTSPSLTEDSPLKESETHCNLD